MASRSSVRRAARDAARRDAPVSGRSAHGRTSARRRQRSVRVTVAVALLGLATLGVLLALPTQSPAALSAAAVGSLVLGWAAVRITWTEVLQSRRENAADRAATADAYRTLFTERAAEHAEFTTAMTERLAVAAMSLREVEGALEASRLEFAAERARAESAESGLTAAMQRIVELEGSIGILLHERAELAELAELDDLIAFDERVARAAGKHVQDDAKLA